MALKRFYCSASIRLNITCPGAHLAKLAAKRISGPRQGSPFLAQDDCKESWVSGRYLVESRQGRPWRPVARACEAHARPYRGSFTRRTLPQDSLSLILG